LAQSRGIWVERQYEVLDWYTVDRLETWEARRSPFGLLSVPMTEPADRTATLVPPRADGAPVEERPVDEVRLEIDDPERYQQVGEHARGGLGRIVRALDRRLGRTVAVKELLRYDELHEARFVREAMITARLEHPGIVPVHEAGRWPNGAPYYVMKLVEGRTLKELLAKTPQRRERLGLLSHVIAVADAVGYAHTKGVIHRDLKPSNVIVGAFGETVVVDWGLALDRRQHAPEPVAPGAAAGSASTEPRPHSAALPAGSESRPSTSGNVVGTPAYMAPEQARGEDVDERADVYAIGAVLYELLAGTAPHGDDTPRSVLDRLVAGPPVPLAAAAPGAPRELVDIVAKAMGRLRSDRYPNATALAEDLRRFQTGQLVSAHAYTRWQRLRKRLRQHRGMVAIAAASLLTLAAVGIESFRTVVAERDIAFAARTTSEERERELVLVEAETSLRKDPTAALAWLERHPINARDLPRAVDVVDEAESLGVARHVFRASDRISDAQFTPDGRRVLVTARDGVLRAYDIVTGGLDELGRAPSGFEALAVAPDGSLAVTAGMLGEVLAWPLAGGPPRTLVARGEHVMAMHFDSAGTRVLVEHGLGPAQIVSLTGAVELVGPESAVRVAIARDDWSRRIAVIAPNEIVTIEPTPRLVARTDRAIGFVALSPAGDTAILHDGESVWAAPVAGGGLVKLVDYHGEVVGAQWSPDCSTVVVFGHAPELPVVDVHAGKVRWLRGHTDALYSAEFARDGRSLLTASDDGTARLWDLGDGSSRVLRGHDDDVYRARFSPDERWAVTASLDGSARVWRIASDGTRSFREGDRVADLAVDGDRAVVRTESSLARWNLTTGAREALFAWDPHGLGIGVPSPDGERLLVPSDHFTFELRRRDGPPIVLRGHTARVGQVQWSRDSRFVFTASFDGTLRRWDAATGAQKVLLSGSEPVGALAVAGDGRVAAAVGDTQLSLDPDGTAHALGKGPAWCASSAEFDRVRDRLIVTRCDHTLAVHDGGQVIELATDGFRFTRLVASPDGAWIAAGVDDRTVRVWDAATGQVAAVFKGHTDLVMDVAFSPDGTRLATASYDHTIRVWGLASGRYRVLRGHSGSVDRIAWHGNAEIVTTSEDGTLRLWSVPDLALPTAPQLVARLAAATTAQIDADNRATTPRASL
jgi:WD40 repeat protein